jgi:hypothetical protein
MSNLSQLIIKKYEGFGGSFIDSQYLAASYETGKPYMFQRPLQRIFSSQSDFISGKPLMSMLDRRPGSVKEIDTENFRWKLEGAEEKYARIVENLESSNTAPGLNNTTFKIKLDLDYYARPDVLFGPNPEYPLAIVDGPIQDGSGFIYTVRIQGDNPSVSYPTELLQVGKEYNKVWSNTQSEFNGEFSGQQYPANFMLESQLSTFAQKIEVTDKAWRDGGRLGFEFNVNGKVVKSFLPMAEAKMYDEIYKSIEAQLWYGKKETYTGSNSRYWKKSGPGVREQLKDSWVEYYNGPLTVSRLEEYLMSVFFTRKDESERNVIATTGTMGKFMFHKMLQGEARSFFTMDTHFIEGVANPSGSKTPGLAYGAEFVRYRGPLGIVVDLNHNRNYDSRDYCKIMHPSNALMPIDSMRMTFMDWGKTNGENNIQMVKIKDFYRDFFVAGSHTPTGPVRGGQAGAPIAGYSKHVEDSAGIVIFDVSKCGELIYDLD